MSGSHIAGPAPVRPASRPGRPAAVVLGLLLLLACALLPASSARAAAGDVIGSYDIEYTIDAQGVVHGRETISYSFAPGTRRGIYLWWTVRRDIAGREGVYRLYDLTVDKVSSPTGAPADFRVESDGAGKVVRIGDPDKTVRGTQTYVIEYTVRGVPNGIDSNGTRTQEIYLNPVGFSWEARIRSVTVTVNAPAHATRTQCFAGAAGTTSQARCQQENSGNTTTYRVGELASGEGVSFTNEYPGGTFASDTPIILQGSASGGPSIEETLPSWARTGLTGAGYGVGALAVAGSVAGMTLAHRRRGRDEQYLGLTPGVMPADGAEGSTGHGSGQLPVAVRFEPPENTRPGLIGTLVDESADTVDVSATLIDLAVRGYLRIEEVRSGPRGKDDWQLTRTSPPPGEAALLPYEQRLYDGVFRKRESVRLSALKNTFASTLERVRMGMYRQVVTEGWYRDSPEKVRSRWSALGWLLVAAGAGAFVVPVMVGGSFGGALGLTTALFAAAAGILVAGVVVLTFARRMPARTARGSAMLAQAKGFEQYLATAEASQIRFEEAERIFSRYLPYAIVFGLSERWGKTFEDVRALADEQGFTIGIPAWYVFHGTQSALNFMALADGIDSFATTAAGTFLSVPSSAGSATPGSSGGSGFSAGGGFAGGGGFGGGGGGSW